MGRASLWLGLVVTACFNPGSGETSDTDDASTGGPTTSATTPSTSAPTSSDPTSETTPTSSPTTTMTTDQPTTTAPTTGDESSTGDIVCEKPETACGGECVNTADNPLHCGACGHDCLGGECVEGACQAVELANGKGRLFMVQLLGDDLYYGGDGVDVGRIGKDGTNDEIIAPAGPEIEDREWCYDSTATNEEILWGNDWVTAHWAVRGCEAPSCAGGPTQYIPDTANIGALRFVPAENRLFWDQDGEIHVMAWPGGADNIFVQSQNSISSIAYDDEYLYWVDFQAMGDVDIRRQNLDGTGGAVNMVLNRPVSLGRIAVSADAIFWAEGGDVVSAPLPNGIGTDEPDPVGSAGGDVWEVHVDDEHVYWPARGASTGSVQRCPLDGCGGAPEILAEGIDNPWSMNQDDVAVYWVSDSGSIWKIAK